MRRENEIYAYGFLSLSNKDGSSVIMRFDAGKARLFINYFYNKLNKGEGGGLGEYYIYNICYFQSKTLRNPPNKYCVETITQT